MCLNCLTWICNSYRNTDLISGKILGHMHTTVTVACWKLKVKLQSVPRRTEPSCEDTETPLFQMCLKTQSSTSVSCSPPAWASVVIPAHLLADIHLRGKSSLLYPLETDSPNISLYPCPLYSQGVSILPHASIALCLYTIFFFIIIVVIALGLSCGGRSLG